MAAAKGIMVVRSYIRWWCLRFAPFKDVPVCVCVCFVPFLGYLYIIILYIPVLSTSIYVLSIESKISFTD